MGDRAGFCADLAYAGFVLENLLTKVRYRVLERPAGERENMTNKNTTNFPLGDFLARVKNAAMAGKKELTFKSTSLVEGVAGVLKQEKYVDEIEKKNGDLNIRLAYHSKKPVLMDIKLVSKPGLRVYAGVDEIQKRRSPSIWVISTSKGVMSQRQAINAGLGGEVLAEVF